MNNPFIIRDAEVAGSNPVAPTTYLRGFSDFYKSENPLCLSIFLPFSTKSVDFLDSIMYEGRLPE